MTERITLFFEPLDVLQFRDHKPFDAGYNVDAESHFPLPSVFLGCVRTALLRLSGARFGGRDFGLGGWKRELLGSPMDQGKLALRGPLWARLVAEDKRPVEPVFELPADVRSTDEGWHVLRPYAPEARRLHGPEGTVITGDVAWTEAHGKKTEAPLLTRAGAEGYSKAGAGRITFSEAHHVKKNELFKPETRVGITRSDVSLTADDRMFYVTRTFRVAAGAGFAVDVELPVGEASALIRKLDGMVVPLGGKAHRARIRIFEGPLIPEELTPEGDGAQKLWLVTPLPLDPKLERWPAGITCAASDRTIPIGGFDMANRAPKPLRRALPAGTVLWLRDIKAGDALAGLAGDTWESDRRAGYGVALWVKGAEG